MHHASQAARLAIGVHDLPPLWRLDVQACAHMLAFVRDAFQGPLDAASVDAQLAGLTDQRAALVSAGDVEVVPLLDAMVSLGLLHLGRGVQARAAARLLSDPGSSSSGAGSFPAWVRARVLTGTLSDESLEAHRAYGRLVARSRWRARRGVLAALLLIDLDAFKVINDSHGHAVGDEVLRLVGEKVLSLVRPGDLALRLGGDEFAVILEDDHEPESGWSAIPPDGFTRTATARADALREAVASTDWGRLAIGVSVDLSIGVAVAVLTPDRPGGADRLYRAADADLYAATSAHTVRSA